MPNGGLLKTRGVSIDTSGVKKALRNSEVLIREAIAEQTRRSLEAMVQGINDNAALRATAVKKANINVSSGTVDRPLAGAKVVTIGGKRSRLGSRDHRLVVYVEHTGPDGANLFNILDGGTPRRTVKVRFAFPVYTSNTTGSNRKERSGSPSAIRRSMIGNKAQLKYNSKGKPIIASPAVGKPLKGIAPRKFYEAAARYIQSELDKGNITIDAGKKLGKISISSFNIEIGVTDRNRFDKPKKVDK